MRTLTEKLASIEAQRDGLLSERESSCQSSTEEMEKLLCRVTSLSEERDQLQETLEGLRQEKKQLRAELEDRMEMVKSYAEYCKLRLCYFSILAEIWSCFWENTLFFQKHHYELKLNVFLQTS